MKRQVNSSSNFSSVFSVISHNCSVNFYLMHFLLWTKGSRESTNFDTFNCSGKNLPNFSCHFPNHKSVFVKNFAWPVSVMKDNSSVYTFLGQVLYSLHQRDQWKFKFLRLLHGSKFPKFLSVLKEQIASSSNFALLSSVMRHNFSRLF